VIDWVQVCRLTQRGLEGEDGVNQDLGSSPVVVRRCAPRKEAPVMYERLETIGIGARQESQNDFPLRSEVSAIDQADREKMCCAELPPPTQIVDQRHSCCKGHYRQ
jgi:hypothetical protein